MRSLSIVRGKRGIKAGCHRHASRGQAPGQLVAPTPQSEPRITLSWPPCPSAATTGASAAGTSTRTRPSGPAPATANADPPGAAGQRGHPGVCRQHLGGLRGGDHQRDGVSRAQERAELIVRQRDRHHRAPGRDAPAGGQEAGLQQGARREADGGHLADHRVERERLPTRHQVGGQRAQRDVCRGDGVAGGQRGGGDRHGHTGAVGLVQPGGDEDHRQPGEQGGDGAAVPGDECSDAGEEGLHAPLIASGRPISRCPQRGPGSGGLGLCLRRGRGRRRLGLRGGLGRPAGRLLRGP